MLRKPNFFIVGAPKCGTTAMYAYLKSHPDIYLTPLKELYFFGQDLTYLQLKRMSLADYLALFTAVTQERIIGEASVTYLVSASAAAEIKAFNPDARILIMLRNPVDMMYAMHSQALFTQVENVTDFAQALALEPARKNGQHIPPRATILNFILYRELAAYTQQVRRYFDVFGRDRVQVIIYDDFRQDVAGVYQRVLQFLDIDATYQLEHFDRVNANKVRRNEWLIRLGNHPQIVRAVRRLLPSRRVRQYIAARTRFMMIREQERPPLPDTLRAQLQEEFLPEIESLSSLLGRDLTHWCRQVPGDSP